MLSPPQSEDSLHPPILVVLQLTLERYLYQRSLRSCSATISNNKTTTHTNLRLVPSADMLLRAALVALVQPLVQALARPVSMDLASTILAVGYPAGRKKRLGRSNCGLPCPCRHLSFLHFFMLSLCAYRGRTTSTRSTWGLLATFRLPGGVSCRAVLLLSIGKIEGGTDTLTGSSLNTTTNNNFAVQIEIRTAHTGDIVFGKGRWVESQRRMSSLRQFLGRNSIA